MKNKEGLSENEFLNNYDVNEFERPSVTVDNLCFTIREIPNKDVRKLKEKKLQILLLLRTNHPCIYTWILPGVFVNMNESLKEASMRALKEKTSFSDIYLEQLYSFGEVNRDKRTRVISVTYMGLIARGEVKIKDTIHEEKTKWFDIDLIEDKNSITMILESEDGISLKAELKKKDDSIILEKAEGIGFDHAKMIYYGILRMRNKIEYTDIAFSMLPEEFTFAELQQVYELILNKAFTKANFQRKIKDRVVSTEKYKTGGFRPAKLYKFKGL